jgi:hypothetical protein
MPSPDGDAAVVNRYCVPKFAEIADGDAGAVTLCEAARPSLQLSQTY